MSVKGIIKGGKVELPEGVQLPEGAAVTLILDSELAAQRPEWVERMAAMAKPRQWPPGYIRNLDAFLAGDARRP